MSSTIYDSVYRTLLNDCTQLIIPVINEIFGTNYTGNEEIQLFPNENIITSPEGELITRITDSNFVVIKGISSRYHLECESKENDNTMIIRMFEYDSQVALTDVRLEGNTLHVQLPKSAIIYLRHNANTPDEFYISFEDGDQQLIRTIPTIKIQRYTLDEIFEKELYYFLPFYIFVHEKDLALYNEDEEKRSLLLDEYKSICQRLTKLWKKGKMDELTVDCIVNGMKQVLKKIASKYENVVKEGEKAMGGEILDYPAKAARREGLAEGREEGTFAFIFEKLDSGESDSVIVEKLKKYFGLDESVARNYIKECQKSNGIFN